MIMKKNIFFLVAVFSVILLTQSGCSGSNPNVNDDGILGDLDEYVQDFYTKSSAAAAYDQRIYQEESDQDEAKATKLRTEAYESFIRLNDAREKAYGRELCTEVKEGTPLKVIKPFTVTNIEYMRNAAMTRFLLEDYDGESANRIGFGLENIELMVTLEAELEVTENVQSQYPIFYNAVDAELTTVQRAQTFSLTKYDNAPAGTRIKVTTTVRDECIRPYNKDESLFRVFNKINQIQKAILDWETD